MNSKRLTDYLKRNGAGKTAYAALQHLKDMRSDTSYNRRVHAGEEEVSSPDIPPECRPLISILVPVYRPIESHFRQMLRSVKAQTYDNYELILAEGGGISDNTNAALSEAKGEYIALLDQDDILHRDALKEAVLAISRGARMVYTDEDKYEETKDRYLRAYRKRDFDMELLLSNNYICHFLVIEKQLVLDAGGFRKEYDGAQDHDLILRCAERTERDRIAHVKRVLYHWRIHEHSTAGDPGAKDYAHDAGRRAIEDHLKRMGLSGTVKETEHRGFYRVEYDLPEGIAPEDGAVIHRMHLGEGIRFKDPKDLLRMAAFMEANKDVGALGGRVVDRLGRVVASSYDMDEHGRLKPLFHGMRNGMPGEFNIASQRLEVAAVSPKCMMLRPELEDLYCDDPGSMCQAIRSRGYRIVTDPCMVFIKDR